MTVGVKFIPTEEHFLFLCMCPRELSLYGPQGSICKGSLEVFGKRMITQISILINDRDCVCARELRCTDMAVILIESPPVYFGKGS